MKNTNQKMKKWAVIAGLGLVCCVMVAVIGSRFQAPSESMGGTRGELVPAREADREQSEPVFSAENASALEDMVVKPNADSKPSDTGSADSTGTEQTIAPDPIKPQPPEKPDTAVDTSKPHDPPKDDTLINPDKKPDSKPVPPPEVKPEPPQVGEGEIYIPGFGGVTNEGGGAESLCGGSGEQTGSDGDWDKVIGY